MKPRDMARAIVESTHRAAMRTTANRRVQLVSSSSGRHLVKYRGQEITLPSSWGGGHTAGIWYNAAYVDGQLQIVQPSAYGGKIG